MDINVWLSSHLAAKILGPRGSKENPNVWSEWQLHSLPEASAILPIGPNAGIFHRQDFIIRTLHSKQKKGKGNMIDWHCFPAVLSYIVWEVQAKRDPRLDLKRGMLQFSMEFPHIQSLIPQGIKAIIWKYCYIKDWCESSLYVCKCMALLEPNRFFKI